VTTGGTTGAKTGMTNEIVGGVRVGADARCSNASSSPAWYSAQWTGFSLSISAQGIPSIISGIGAASASSGHTYAAMAIPDVRTVMASMQAISRQNDEKKWRIAG
jgi:hypothetical protein